MAYRRVVRADEKSSEISEIQKPEKSTHVCNSFFRCLYRVVSVLWKCIKTLWYWTERFILVGLLFGLTTGLAWWLSQKPSLYRDWEDMDAVLPTISWSGNSVTIDNIRNHTWSSSKDFVPSYFTENYNIDTITGLTYIITPFSDSDGPAHTMFLFSFSGGKDIIISPEVRKERGESFSAFLGLMNQYELQYVIGTPDDLIKLRTNYRNNEVIAYPIQVEKAKIQALFRSMLIRTDKLSREPEFYNTLWNNCATSLLHHANALRLDKLSVGIYQILPSHSDEVLYRAGLIDTKLSLSGARAYYRIDESMRSYTGTDIGSIIHKTIQ